MLPYFYNWNTDTSVKFNVLSDVATCERCSRWKEVGPAVPPWGYNDVATWLVVGACPGRQEVKNRVPFYPKAPGGAILVRYFRMLNITRPECYITNACFCMGIHDRLPTIDEVKVCSKWKMAELRNLTKVGRVLLLGNTATRMFLGDSYPSLVKSNGSIEELEFPHTLVKVLVVHHPGYVLRNPSIIVNVKQALEKFVKEN